MLKHFFLISASGSSVLDFLVGHELGGSNSHSPRIGRIQDTPLELLWNTHPDVSSSISPCFLKLMSSIVGDQQQVLAKWLLPLSHLREIFLELKNLWNLRLELNIAHSEFLNMWDQCLNPFLCIIWRQAFQSHLCTCFYQALGETPCRSQSQIGKGWGREEKQSIRVTNWIHRAQCGPECHRGYRSMWRSHSLKKWDVKLLIASLGFGSLLQSLLDFVGV